MAVVVQFGHLVMHGCCRGRCCLSPKKTWSASALLAIRLTLFCVVRSRCVWNQGRIHIVSSLCLSIANADARTCMSQLGDPSRDFRVGDIGV